MAEEKEICDTIIVGSGPAGLTAAIYNVRANLKTLVIGGDQPGGQLTITTMVENYPGFPTGIGGVKLMMDMQAQVRNLGVTIKNGLVQGIKPFSNPSLDRAGHFEVALDNGEKLETRAVIIATGAKAKWLNIGEKEYIGKGVSGCATCDGAFFRNKVVAVVGGGDVACTDADFLARLTSKVYLIHRRDTLRAQVALYEKVKNNPKIEFVWNSEVTGINPSSPNPSGSAGAEPPSLDRAGSDHLKSVLLKNNKTNEEKVMEIDGLFVAIGHDPAVEFVKDLVEIKENGRIRTMIDMEYMTMTSQPGMFAAGDCVDDVYRQAIVAAGDGCRAALDAERWIGNVK